MRKARVRLSNFLHCLGDLRRPHVTVTLYRCQSEFQRAREREYNRQILHRNRVRAFRRLIAHAHRTVPFYGSLWRERGTDPAEIRTLNDLQHLPILSRQQLQEQPQEKLISSVDGSAELRTTSGTTSEPRLFLKDRTAEIYHHVTVRRYFLEYGVPRGSTILFLQTGADRSITYQSRVAEHWTRRILASISDLVESPRRLAALTPALIVGSPRQLEALAAHIYAPGHVAPPPLFVNIAERLDGATRHRIQSLTGSEIVDVYCTSELSTLIGFECRSGSGFHINADYLIVEIVGPDGTPVAPGEQGEVVITDLYNYISPLIRYRIGDIATATGDDCRCGRALPRSIAQIDGRSIDQVHLPDGRIVDAFSLIDDLQSMLPYPITLVQETPETFQLICYLMHTSPTVIARNKIQRLVHAHLGANINFTIHVRELTGRLSEDPTKIRPFLSRLTRAENDTMPLSLQP